ncbi:hypothetical protein M3O96_14470 [Aquiflexum sp. TKW24L]|uniref:hypothetical protein n=1 Tax=Aquiflexum sp. TKW24L TaxID=2942212 RepID=UPI0020BE1737|nr:hypothetical protein [Aquiflexum sp. TKW24L]MCL6260303.1 hypothetical protein [Aquiflexum sp. TKW24L]
MKKLLLSMSLLLWMCPFHANAQSRINLELYTVPNQGYQNFLNDPLPSMDFTTPIGVNFGLGLSYNINKNWQFVLQSWAASSPFGYTLNPENSGSSFLYVPQRNNAGFAFRNYSLGFRKTWEVGENEFYVQPSLGINLSRDYGIKIQDSVLNFKYTTYVVPSGSLEVGMKFNTPGNNYFLLGLRHHQGFGMLNESNLNWIEETSHPVVQRRGTYTGLVLGYGIDFRRRGHEKKEDWRVIKKERKSEKRMAAWGDGSYVMLTSLLRSQPDFEKNDIPGITRFRPATSFLFGYTSGQWSFETGYSSWMSQTKTETENFGLISLSDPMTRAIPLRARYHWDIGEKNRLRFGVSAATFVTLNTIRTYVTQRGALVLDDERVPVLLSTPSTQRSGGKLFFQAGAFMDIPLFNSSILSFNFSQNFGSPEVGFVNVQEIVNGQRIDYSESGNLNGFNLELGFKIPISTLMR